MTSDALGWQGGHVFALAGELPPAPRLAIVGARAAHRRWLGMVGRMVDAALDEGWTLVSGGAIGTDAQAHRHALERGCPQLAILPCGPDRLYPPHHRDLFERIVDAGGGVLCAQAFGTPPTRAMFASRNRWIVRSAKAVIVVQAARRSGSLRTGRMALAQGTALAAVIGSAGCAELIARGAHPIRQRAADEPATLERDVAGWLGAIGQPAQPAPFAGPAHLRDVRETLRARGARGASAEDFADPLLACARLLEAEVLGLACEIAPGRFVWVGG